MSEKQTCPDRFWFGVHNKSEGLDSWVVDRWMPRSDGGTVVWGWSWMPRSCSFCGGIHPDDAIRLVREGWKVEATGKFYKRYLNPPDGLGVVPPVKLYVFHFDLEARKLFNLAIGGAL